MVCSRSLRQGYTAHGPLGSASTALVALAQALPVLVRHLLFEGEPVLTLAPQLDHR